MRLSVKNLGPIKEGTIDLNKRLTIITGPNNTGKSYLTYLIHALSQYEDLNGISASIRDVSATFKDVASLRQHLLAEEVIDLDELLSNTHSNISRALSDIIKRNFVKIFASTAVAPELNIDLKDDISNKMLTYYKSIQVIDNELYGDSWDAPIEKVGLKGITANRFPDIGDRATHFLGIITTVILDTIVNSQSFFFPAERTAINLFAKHITSTKAEIKDELDSEIISDLSDEELVRRLRAQSRIGPKYPFAIRTYINFVNSFEAKSIEGEFAPLASRMETILMGGKMHLDEFEQLIFTPNNSTIPLELHLSSSLVKSLSYIILYLRYYAEKGNLIIIDEPELNLHPDLQIAIAKIIVEMVNAGLKVMISTHSDYLIKELNNLVLLHDLNETKTGQSFIQEKGYNSTQLLDKRQVGAYYLNNNAITVIDVEATGIEVPSINDAISAIDSLTEEILYQL